MDIIVTVALIYLAYRGYSWYSATQERLRSESNPPIIDEREFDRPTPDDDGEFIDYEEVP
ncbi:MAG: hypothetical protein AAFN92_01985 [Bacteroidota bacterium]